MPNVIVINNKRDYKHTTTNMPAEKLRQGTFLKKEEPVIAEVETVVEAPAKQEEVKVEVKADEPKVEVKAEPEMKEEVKAVVKEEVKEIKPEKKTGLKKVLNLGKK